MTFKRPLQEDPTASSKTPVRSPEDLQAELDAIKARRASRAQRDVKDAARIRQAAEQDRHRQEEVRRRVPLYWLWTNADREQWSPEQWESWLADWGARDKAAERARERDEEPQLRADEALKTARKLLGLRPDSTMYEIRLA